jgi:hypothetical protein
VCRFVVEQDLDRFCAAPDVEARLSGAEGLDGPGRGVADL